MLERSGMVAPLGLMTTLRRAFLPAACLVLLLVSGAALAPTASLARGPDSVADIAEGLQDTVVNISTTQTLKGSKDGGAARGPGPKGSPFEEFFDDFFDDEEKDGLPRKVSSLGSGFVIDPSGLIVTNNHVIEGADEIIINFTDGTKLKVDQDSRPRSQDRPRAAQGRAEEAAARPSPSAIPRKMRVGDWVMAIGNPFGLGGSVTVGIISATKRDINAGPYDDFLQTDAAINRGNSGGPLVQHGRSGDRREYGDHLAERRLDRHRLRRALEQRRAGGRSAQAIWRDAARLARRARAERDRRDRRELGSARAEGRARRHRLARQPGRRSRHPAERRDPRISTARPSRTCAACRARLPRRPIGKSVAVGLLRKGETVDVNVTVGRLPESEEAAGYEP